MAVSALLNFRMGYRSADTELDGWIYGIGAGLADALKALAPFMAAYGAGNRDWLATGAAILLFVVFTAYSFTAAMGFAAEHRSARTAEVTMAIETRSDLRTDLRRHEEELTRLDAQRPSAEIDADIAVLLQTPVGPRQRMVMEISADCTLNRASTRTACGQVMVLRAELARAQHRERTEDAVRQLRINLERGAGEGARAAPDAQVDAIKRFAAALRHNISESQIGFLLSVLLALLVELGSGLGLYVATTPWRRTAKDVHIRTGAPTVGPVEAFMLETIEPRTGAELTVADLHHAYLRWCVGRGQIAMPRKDFAQQFGTMAGLAGIHGRLRNRTTVYESIALTQRSVNAA